MKTWRISINGRVLETVHKTYRSALFAAQVLRGMGSKAVKVVSA
jgi:hypothetical protein